MVTAITRPGPKALRKGNLNPAAAPLTSVTCAITPTATSSSLRKPIKSPSKPNVYEGIKQGQAWVGKFSIPYVLARLYTYTILMDSLPTPTQPVNPDRELSRLAAETRKLRHHHMTHGGRDIADKSKSV